MGRAIAKTEEAAAAQLMTQVKSHTPDGKPPAMATDGKGGYRQARVQTWAQVPDYSGRGRPATLPKPGKDWQYLPVVKKRQGSRLVGVQLRLVYGDPDEVKATLGAHTASVERTHLTARQMNGRLVRKTLSFSKELCLLEAASCWEDALYNFTPPLKTRRLQVGPDPSHPQWLPRTPAQAAGLTDHIWTVKELLTTVLVPLAINT